MVNNGNRVVNNGNIVVNNGNMRVSSQPWGCPNSWINVDPTYPVNQNQIDFDGLKIFEGPEDLDDFG